MKEPDKVLAAVTSYCEYASQHFPHDEPQDYERLLHTFNGDVIEALSNRETFVLETPHREGFVTRRALVIPLPDSEGR